MMSGKLVIGVWLCEVGCGNIGVLVILELILYFYLLLNYLNNQVNGLVIIIDELVVIIFDVKVIFISQLLICDVCEIQFFGYLIKILIYYISLIVDDICMILLGGLLLVGLVGILVYYILIVS